ncbi:MAG: GAF domain-containing protein [Planctomycetota bacterium]|jgi:two-component system sensor kinase FixL
MSTTTGEKEAILRKLYEATLGGEQGFSQRLQRLFELGHELLGLRIGILAEISEDNYRIVHASAPAEFDLQPGTEFVLGETYCALVMDAEEPVGFQHAGATAVAEHPAYGKFQLESYFGVPVLVQGRVFGTLNFSDPEPRSEAFTGFHGEVLRLMGRWCGSEIERAEDIKAIEKQAGLLQTLADAHSNFILAEDVRTVFDQLLAKLLNLTDSEYGFIGEVLRDPDGTPYLKTHAITNIAWNEETRRFYEENAPSGLEFRNLDNLFGRVLTTGSTVIANDPDQDPRAGGRPPGHPPLRRFLGLPIHAGDTMVGMIGIANRPEGYDEEICSFLRPFLTTCGTLIRALDAERQRSTAMHALRDSEARSRAVLETAAEGIITIDEHGTVQSYNSSCERIFGYKQDEIVGKNVSMLMGSPHRERHDSYLEKYLRTGERTIIGIGRELTGRRKNGTDVPIYLAVGEVPHHDGRWFTGMIYDISELKQARDALHDRAEQLARSNRELESFAFIASHDLQEPLRKVTAFGDLLASTSGAALDDRGRDYIGRMRDAAVRMRKLINDLLSYSRVTTNARPFAAVELSEVVRGVVSDLEVLIQQTGATLEVGELVSIPADETQMRQLLQNLIGNAMKFRRPDTPPRVRIAMRRLDPKPPTQHEFVELVVEDNGIGFEQEYAERIFGIFERLHGRRDYEGTGIGLALCRKIVERHGGEIAARGRPGEGATFIARLRADLMSGADLGQSANVAGTES